MLSNLQIPMFLCNGLCSNDRGLSDLAFSASAAHIVALDFDIDTNITGVHRDFWWNN